MNEIKCDICVCVCVCVYTHTHTYNICTIEYYSAFKREDILTQATTWMDLENIMLCKISQTEKD